MSSTDSQADTVAGEVQSDTPGPGDGNVSESTSEPCQVCGDQAIGFHFNATICKSCKNFFNKAARSKSIIISLYHFYR